jgi:hypothetical protein
MIKSTLQLVISSTAATDSDFPETFGYEEFGHLMDISAR